MPEVVLKDANRPVKTMPKSTTADRTGAEVPATSSGIESEGVWIEQDIISLQLQSAIFKDGCSEILNWKEISIAEFLVEF